jgi:hypothetical protein
MEQLSIDSAATAQILRLLAASGCEDPVPSLGESSTASRETFARYRDAHRSRALDEQSLADLAISEFQLIERTLHYEICINVFERRDYELADLVQFGGAAFAMPEHMRTALLGFTLSHDEHGFLLRRGLKVVRNLRSLQTN